MLVFVFYHSLRGKAMIPEKARSSGCWAEAAGLGIEYHFLTAAMNCLYWAFSSSVRSRTGYQPEPPI